jgi:hypothetical protein
MDGAVSTIQWRVIDEFPSYEISSDGDIRRLSDGVVLVCPADHAGRRRVTFSVPGTKVYRYIHRLVATAFHGPAPAGKNFACHVNGDFTDNRADNLYWGDAKTNRQDAVRHGTAARSGPKFTPAQRAEIRAAASTMSAKMIAREFGCDPSYGRYVRARVMSEVARYG